MTEFVSIKSLLSTVPKVLLQESEQSDWLYWFREALRLLPSITATEAKVEIFELTESKFQLPKYVKTINSVKYLSQDPSEEDLTSYNECLCAEPESEDIIPQVCKPQIYYKMFIDSPYYQHNYALLRYAGSDKNMFCKNCPNLTCDNTLNFVLTRERMLYTNFDAGFLCIDYDQEVCDESGNIMIPDIEEVQQFLVKFAIMRHLEERQFAKEEGMRNMYQDYKQESEIWLRKAKSTILFKQLNPHTIQGITEGWFKRLIKLPSIYVYER